MEYLRQIEVALEAEGEAVAAFTPLIGRDDSGGLVFYIQSEVISMFAMFKIKALLLDSSVTSSDITNSAFQPLLGAHETISISWFQEFDTDMKHKFSIFC